MSKENTFVQQSNKLVTWLKKKRYKEVKSLYNNTSGRGFTYSKTGFWGKKDSSRYLIIRVPNPYIVFDWAQEPITLTVRFSGHRQPVRGGYSIKNGGNFGRKDISIDPYSGYTWRDVVYAVKHIKDIEEGNFILLTKK